MRESGPRSESAVTIQQSRSWQSERSPWHAQPMAVQPSGLGRVGWDVDTSGCDPDEGGDVAISDGQRF